MAQLAINQLAINIDGQLSERLEKVANTSGKSKSKWVVEAIKRSLQDQWSHGFFELAASWEDDEGPDEVMKRIRKGMDISDS